MTVRFSRAAIIAGTSALWVAQAVLAEDARTLVRSRATAQRVSDAPNISPVRAKARLAAAALAAQKDTDPAMNGSIGGRSDQPITHEMRAAAEAARHDHDPSINGAIGVQGQAGVVPNAVAKR